MERAPWSLTDAANQLSINDLLSRSIRTVIDDRAEGTAGLSGVNGSPKTLPNHELHQAQRTILAIFGTLTELVAEPASRVTEVACAYWESRALYIAAERRIPDLWNTAGEKGMSAEELGKASGIESAKSGGRFPYFKVKGLLLWEYVTDASWGEQPEFCAACVGYTSSERWLRIASLIMLFLSPLWAMNRCKPTFYYCKCISACLKSVAVF